MKEGDCNGDDNGGGGDGDGSEGGDDIGGGEGGHDNGGGGGDDDDDGGEGGDDDDGGEGGGDPDLHVPESRESLKVLRQTGELIVLQEEISQLNVILSECPFCI